MRAIRNRALTIRRQGSDIQGRVLGEHVSTWYVPNPGINGTRGAIMNDRNQGTIVCRSKNQNKTGFSTMGRNVQPPPLWVQ